MNEKVIQINVKGASPYDLDAMKYGLKLYIKEFAENNGRDIKVEDIFWY